ncbi:acetyl-CoA synthetase-like protein [Polyplosphaeria fusca]|uniref:Acetyl-CoA synthetase-like protein n=1 Tax=Polyplosphaeria fusca TaxID=682080 RepID=A0A9P4QNW2_9PLEO|nr:acetyl-CoA synthetase-like protein [Polyplosphaeria fusca]
MASGLTVWPVPDKTLLPHHVDKIAEEHPDAVYASIPKSPTTFTDGFRDVTYRHLRNAVDGLAMWIQQTLGRSDGVTFPTLTYFGPNDLRHAILLLAAVKTGYKMLFPSPRYSKDALVKLIRTLDGSIMLAPSSNSPITDAVVSAAEMSAYTIPELESLLDTPHAPYPYLKTFEGARSEPLVALHTSGTTGFPKPIVWTHDWADSFVIERALEPPPEYESMDGYLLGTRLLTLMPPFHASGIFGSILFSLSRGSVLVYPHSGGPPSAAIAAEALRHTTADTLAMPAVFVEEMAGNPNLLDEISSRIQVVMYAGGDLSVAAGDVVASTMRLFTACGSTEMGLWPILRPADNWYADRWHYMHLHPAMNMTMDLSSETGQIHEAVIEKNTNSRYIQPIFRLFPQLQRYHSGDLFTRHPTNPNLWKFYGRADDMQSFLSGEKFHPVDVEHLICEHTDVVEALLVGTMRPKAALLLRLREEVDGNIEPVWPTIEKANEMCPSYAVIARPLVHIVDAAQPFPRTAKGTVQRKAAAELYKKELDELYHRAGGMTRK